MRISWLGLLACALLSLPGCATLPTHVQKLPSRALADPGSTRLGEISARASPDRKLSGIRLLTSGDEAFASLIALCDRAERTLDIQYYLIHQDDSARTLLHHLRRAAERGVRVRLLVDDLNTTGEDRRFMHLGQHANVEVRVFNPFAGGRFALWARFLFAATDIPRINHRMHNKLFVADNTLAITGGRNIGDEYFTRNLHNNFIDLDVVASGLIVPQLSASFDAFWNSKFAYPIAAVAAPVDPDNGTTPQEDIVEAPNVDWLAHELDAGRLHMIWVPATVLADRPGKIANAGSAGVVSPDVAPPGDIAPRIVADGARKAAHSDSIANSIAALMRSARKEVIIISPYFVPGSDGVALMRELTERGVRIRVLTNSLASTDSPLVHNGYARYRVELLKLGVELSEVRPKLGQKRARFHPFKSSNASLHAKSLVIDHDVVFIGSMNMDARSAHTNSELGLVMRSAEIARQVTNLLDDISADGSYRLSLDAGGRLEWSSGDPDAERHWFIDPETTRLQRLWLEALAPFAPEELL